MLLRMGAPFKARGEERAAVYLTNALSGWQAEAPRTASFFPDLDAERDAAQRVKRERPIFVVLGNPPYNAFAGVAPEEEGDLLDAYKIGLSEWGVTKHSLDDLYVRFLRVATRRIAESEEGGVVCLISNFSYLGDPGHVLVRKRLLDDA
jgi:predicted helicase